MKAGGCPVPDASFGITRKITTAYVVFSGQGRWSFWNWFLDPGFMHCWLILPVPYPAPGLMSSRFSLKIEPLSWGIDTEVWFADPDAVAESFARIDTVSAILSYTFETPGPWKPLHGLRGLITCVGVCKNVLGIANHRILTPKHLFGYILRNRGKIVHI